MHEDECVDPLAFVHCHLPPQNASRGFVRFTHCSIVRDESGAWHTVSTQQTWAEQTVPICNWGRREQFHVTGRWRVTIHRQNKEEREVCVLGGGGTGKEWQDWT